MLLSSVLAIVTLVAAPAAAHFKMTNPVPRGDREVTMDKAPCGGFDTPSRKRTCFGPKSTFSVDMTDKNAFMTIKLGSGPNPRSFPVQMSTRRFAEIGVYTSLQISRKSQRPSPTTHWPLSSSPRLLVTGSFTSVLMLLSVFNIVEKSLVILFISLYVSQPHLSSKFNAQMLKS
ncbi:hypothetical protein BASA61_002135 [Batrachochytrium salamandrivorans]|nr:hypothetical protein BASA61_002135 [Batrachochytrium salamandrivorans]